MQAILAAAWLMLYFLPIVAGQGLYASIVVLLLATSATTLCLSYFGIYRHRAALWQSICMAGLSCFAMSVLGFNLASIAGVEDDIASTGVLHIAWSVLGTILVAHSLPRFLVAAFGTVRRPFVYRLLDIATGIIAALAIFRVASIWNTALLAPALSHNLLRVTLFALIAIALGLTMAFQSRLPDRNLYKAVIAQICAMSILLPVIVLEEFNLLSFSGFTSLGLLVLIGAASISTMLHAHNSFRRPKYVVGDVPSPFFAERFGLSERELEVVSALLQGLSNDELAKRLFISTRTVENHLYENLSENWNQKSRSTIQPFTR